MKIVSKVLIVIGAIISIIPYLLIIGIPLLIIGYVLLFRTEVKKKKVWLMIPISLLVIEYVLLTFIGM